MPVDENAVETVALDGELVIDTVRRTLDRLVAGTSGSHVVVDLAGVAFIDSTGLRMLLDAKTGLAAQGRTLRIVNPTSAARLLFDTTGTAEDLGVVYD
jgi:anti-anti-sigma factor